MLQQILRIKKISERSIRSWDQDHRHAHNIKLFTSYRLIDSREEKEMGRSKCPLNSLQSDRVSSLVLSFLSHVFTSISNGFWNFQLFPLVSLSRISFLLMFSMNIPHNSCQSDLVECHPYGWTLECVSISQKRRTPSEWATSSTMDDQIPSTNQSKSYH